MIPTSDAEWPAMPADRAAARLAGRPRPRLLGGLLLGLGLLGAPGAALCDAAAAGNPAAAQVDARLDTLFGAHQPYRDFLVQLQQAIASGVPEQVAALVSYPLRVNGGGKPHLYKTKEALVTDYARVFTPKLQAAIQSQTYAALSATGMGVMIGNGELWFSGVCKTERCERPEVRVIAINR